MTQINREAAIALAEEAGAYYAAGTNPGTVYALSAAGLERLCNLVAAHSRKDAEPVAGLLKPPSMAESGDKTVVDMPRLPKFHDDEAVDYLSRAYKLSKQLTDHLSVSPSQRKNRTAIGWCRVGVIGSETLPFTITQVPRVAEIWREQGLEVLEVFTHQPEADKLLQQALGALERATGYLWAGTTDECNQDAVADVRLHKKTITAIRTYLENKA